MQTSTCGRVHAAEEEEEEEEGLVMMHDADEDNADDYGHGQRPLTSP